MKKSLKTKFFLKAREIRSEFKEELFSLFLAGVWFPSVTKFVQFYLDKSVLFSEFIVNSNLARIFLLVGWIITFECLLFLFFYRFFNELSTNDIDAAIREALKEIRVGLMFVSIIFLLDFLANSFH